MSSNGPRMVWLASMDPDVRQGVIFLAASYDRRRDGRGEGGCRLRSK